MLLHHVTGVAAAIAALAVLAAARLAFTARPSSLRRCVTALRGWHAADRVHLADRTLDHVVVAPAALLAVTATAHAPGVAELRAAEHGAEQLRELARQAGVADITVVPVVLVSGADAPPGGHLVVDGVHLVDDAAPQAWLRQFRDATIPATTRIVLARSMDRRAATPRRSRSSRRGTLLATPEPAGA